MKVLITGATGLIGMEITNLCHKEGIAVHFLTTSREKIVSKENYQGFYWNPSTQEIDIQCFNGVTDIINLAGASISKRWTTNHKKEVLQSRLNALRTLHSGLKKAGTQNIVSFVSASAIGVYPHSLSSFYTEDEKWVDDSFLGEVVHVWESEIDTFNSFPIAVCKLRVGLVMSANGGALPEMSKPIKNYVGAAFGSGEQWQSWIHIEDLARIFIFATKNKLQGIYNGVAPNPVTNNKLVKEIADVLDKPLILPNIPKLVMRTFLGEMAHLLFASQRVSSKKIEEAGFHFNFQNVNGALEDIYGKGDGRESTDSLYQKKFV